MKKLLSVLISVLACVTAGFATDYAKFGDVNVESTTYRLANTYDNYGSNWVRVTSSANWGTEVGGTLLSYNGSMWLVGVDNSTAVWSSMDGTNWTQATASAPWSGTKTGRIAIVFKNAMWVMGGGDGSSYPTDVFVSTDGTNWTTATSSPGWVGRAWSSLGILNSNLWIFCGANDNESPYRLKDVWFTPDGTNWTMAASDTSASQVYGHTMVTYNNALWVMGGNGQLGIQLTYFSLDGTNWTSAGTSVGVRYQSSTVHDGKIWVMSGEEPGPAKVQSTKYSTDGTNWTQTTDYLTTPWAARNYSGACSFNHALWLAGGNGNSGNLGDVWKVADAVTSYTNFSVSASGTGNLTMPGGLVPASANAFDLGSSSYPWQSLYVSNIVENGTALVNKYAKVGTDNTYGSGTSQNFALATVTNNASASTDVVNWRTLTNTVANYNFGITTNSYFLSSGTKVTWLAVTNGTVRTELSVWQLVTNDTFSASSGSWVTNVPSIDGGGSWAFDGQTATLTGPAGLPRLGWLIQTNGAIIVGHTYRVAYTWTRSSTGSIRAEVGGTVGTSYPTGGTYTNDLVAGTDGRLRMYVGGIGPGDTATIDDVTLYDITLGTQPLTDLQAFVVNGLLPSGSNTVDLGSAALPFRDLYVGSNSIWMAGQKMFSVSNGQMVVGLPVVTVQGTNAPAVYLTSAAGGLTNGQTGVNLGISGELLVTATNAGTSPFGSGRGGIVLGGDTTVDKNLLWLDGTKATFSWNTYRNESGKYFYLSDYEAGKDLMTLSRSGRFGINKMNNLLNYHTLTSQADVSSDLELDASKTEYTPNYQLVYLITVTATNAVADLYSIQTSRDSGATWTTQSTGNTMFLTSTNIGNGVWMYWTAVTGHTVGETRKFLGIPQLPRASFSVSPMFIDEVMINTNLFGTPYWVDRTYEANSSQYGEFRPFRAGTNSATYIGMTIPNNSFYVNVTTAGVGVAYTLEYWNGSTWAAALILDGTANFTQSGDITIDNSSVTTWTNGNLTVDTYTNLYYWCRLRSTNIVTTAPYVQSITRHGANRLQVYDAPLDDTPTMRVDSAGNTWIGGLPMSAATVQTFYYKFLAQCPSVATAGVASAVVNFSTEVSDPYNVYTNSIWYPNSASLIRMNWSIRSSTTVASGDGFYVSLYENGASVRDLDLIVSGANTDVLLAKGTYIFKPSNATNYYQIGVRRYAGNSVNLSGSNTNWWFGEKIQ